MHDEELKEPKERQKLTRDKLPARIRSWLGRFDRTLLTIGVLLCCAYIGYHGLSKKLVANTRIHEKLYKLEEARAGEDAKWRQGMGAQITNALAKLDTAVNGEVKLEGENKEVTKAIQAVTNAHTQMFQDIPRSVNRVKDSAESAEHAAKVAASQAIQVNKSVKRPLIDKILGIYPNGSGTPTPRPNAKGSR